MNTQDIKNQESLVEFLVAKKTDRGDHCPVDARIQAYLNDLFAFDESTEDPQLPTDTLILDEPGLARLFSIPYEGDYFSSDIIQSYRVKQGVLHNPRNDRRTTKGVFHIADGGLLVPDDKIQVPLIAFKRMLQAAFQPSSAMALLPITSQLEEPLSCLVSLHLRPLVCPEVPGFIEKKNSEIRFFAPGSLVSNLDFVESIFGNAGDPYATCNDAGLDIHHWTGHTGCVVLAPQLTTLTKKSLGLPHFDEATDRQRRDGVCWRDENERYNNGKPFKITSRDKHGVMVTLIADNYFGYCKKEVKTQISFSANLYGLCEEEHAGGAIAYSSFNLGYVTHPDNTLPWNHRSYEEMIRKYGGILNARSEGYATDEKYSDIVFVPENSQFSLKTQTISWMKNNEKREIKILRDHVYFLPSGYKIHMERLTSGTSWRLIGTVGSGTVCHKPCTVSGGGKSEISKSISDAMIQGPVFIASLTKDLDAIDKILKYDFSQRFKDPTENGEAGRPILSKERSLGSVIKLLTPSDDYSEAYNQWLNNIDHSLKIILYELKRAYKPEWGDDWRDHLSVDTINNQFAHELKIDGQKLVAHYLRVGQHEDGSWRIFKLRSDFCPAQKIQTEDDITASIVVPKEKIQSLGEKEIKNPSLKIVANCETRLFQRPDDAIHRGYDKQAEADLMSPNTFLSNFEPLTIEDAKKVIQDAINFDRFTKPVQDLIKDFVAKGQDRYFVSSSHPRLVNGQPCKNPRYLQERPDLVNARAKYIAELGERLWRFADPEAPIDMPVTAVLSGRRCNPADAEQNVPALAVFNPIHYQELPELFMDYICSVTGKSPSTTGFGSEGALTKGPFNAITFTADLNNALLSFILTGYPGFSSAAGFIGPKVQVDHDISLLIPEIWCRMTPEESNPNFMIKSGYLEKLDDFDYNGKTVLASRLGYRINSAFANHFLGRIFSCPHVVFSDAMLKPETQDMDTFVEGIQNIVETQKNCAERYFNDGSIEFACPPIKALLNIMAYGHYEGKSIESPEVRNLFDRETILASDWYQERLCIKQERELALWQKHHHYIQQRIKETSATDTDLHEQLKRKLKVIHDKIIEVSQDDYLKSLIGTIGADPLST